jgi:hypothetical protein
MSVRLRSRWTEKGRERSLEELATVAATNAWKLAGNGVLNLENEGFETNSRAQRLDLIEEFVAFFLSVTDRHVYGRLEEEDRARFVTAMALHLAGFIQENRSDVQGSGDYRSLFIDLINERITMYSECTYSAGEGPGFSMLCVLGDRITERLGPAQRRWAQDQVVAIEGPESAQALRTSLSQLLGWSDASSRRSRSVGTGTIGDG